ncbi:MAG: L-ribulose-5-phosphate 4-epimerase [Chloroflexota bacterium]
MLEELRERVYEANMALPEEGLVTMTSGNVSGRDIETDLMVIKPSGVKFKDLTPESMVVVDMRGQVVEGEFGPSSDTATHLWVYRNRDDVHGIVHTHSNYATAFAAVNKPIPACLTAIADEFGCDIPCGGYAAIGGKEIGEEILRSIGTSTAILMKNHGVFTIGKTVEKALKSAVMVEDIAKTVWLALQIGVPERLSDEEIASNYERYHTRYGTANASIIDFE